LQRYEACADAGAVLGDIEWNDVFGCSAWMQVGCSACRGRRSFLKHEFGLWPKKKGLKNKQCQTESQRAKNKKENYQIIQ
jgi:hypothetical protein